MNKLQKTTLALVGLGAITAGSMVFAADTVTPTVTNTPAKSVFSWFGGDKGEKHGGRGGMGMMKQFFRTDLTDAEKTAFKDLQTAQREEMKTFIDANKDKMSTTETQTALKAIQQKHMTALLPYVATDKQAEFKTAQENMQVGKMMERGGEGRKGGRGMMEQGKGFGMMLPKAISDKLDTKLAAMSDPNAKITWLKNVSTKIDTLAAKVSGQKSKRLLEEFKNLVNDKIDTLSGNTIDENTLSKILD